MATKSSELFRGAKDILPHHLGVFPFGLVFGVLAIASGLSPLEAILMSSIVFGGASQIVFVQLWSAGVPPFIVGTSVSIVNLRHVLYSASLSLYKKFTFNIEVNISLLSNRSNLCQWIKSLSIQSTIKV